MNKYIKKLVEAVLEYGMFDDDIFDDDENILSDLDVDKHVNEINTKEIINILTDLSSKDSSRSGFFYGLLVELFSDDKTHQVYKYWNDLEDKSLEGKGIVIKNMHLSIHFDTVNGIKKLLDLLLFHNIHIYVLFLTFLLEPDDGKICNITDFIDFRKYDDILTVLSFAITNGKLNNLIGIPSNITHEFIFLWVSYIGTMEGMNNIKANLDIEFDNSSFPKDWTGFINHILHLKLYSNRLNLSEYKLGFATEDDVEFAKNWLQLKIGTLKNFPVDLLIKKNTDFLYGFAGCLLIYNWDKRIKKFVRDYISQLLKLNKCSNLKRVKNLLCSSWCDATTLNNNE